MSNPHLADERHFTLYGDQHGNWLVTTTPTGTIPPATIRLSVYEDGPPPPTRTLTMLGEPGDLVAKLYERMGGIYAGGRGALPVQQRLADLMCCSQRSVSNYIRQLSVPELSDRGWRNLVRTAMEDGPLQIQAPLV